MTTVLLIRHAHSEANAAGVLAGRAPGVHLSAQGHRQARALGTRLRGVPLDAIVHSPLERCRETVDAILERRGSDPAVPLHADDRLTECDYGTWSGQTLKQLAGDPLWGLVQRTPSAVTFPDGESMTAMAQRAVECVRSWVAGRPDSVVAIVSHGDLIKAVLSDALAQPFDQFQRIVVAPASISVVAYGPERTAVVTVNDTGRRRLVAPRAASATVGGGSG